MERFLFQSVLMLTQNDPTFDVVWPQDPIEMFRAHEPSTSGNGAPGGRCSEGCNR